MNQIFAQLFYEMEKHRDTVLVTLIDTAGSAPRKSGSQMLVGASGRLTTIGGKELLYAAQGIMNRTYEAMFPLLGVALIYLILVMLFTWLLSKFERRLAQSDR